MNHSFHQGRGFFRIINKIVDGFYASLLWLLCSLPVITFGASTTALYDTVHKVLRKNRGHIGSSFWSTFQFKFKQATKIWLFLLAVFLGSYAGYRITFEQLKRGAGAGMLCGFFLAVILLAAVWTVYIFAYCAKFEETMKETMKKTAVIAVTHLQWSFFILLMLAAGALAVFLSPVLLAVVPAADAYLFDLFLEKIFRKYLLKEDGEAGLEPDEED